MTAGTRATLLAGCAPPEIAQPLAVRHRLPRVSDRNTAGADGARRLLDCASAPVHQLNLSKADSAAGHFVLHERLPGYFQCSRRYKKTFRRLDALELLADVASGVVYVNGVRAVNRGEKKVAA